MSGNLSIDEFKLVGYYDNKNDFDDVFSNIFNVKIEDIKTQSKTETLNLHYVEPPKMTRTFLQKAKSYKSYLCLDVNDNYVITQKLNKDVHKHIIGLCVDSSINAEGKLTVLFCPLKFISLIQPELGSVGKRGNVVFCKDDMKDITVIDTQDGITGTKRLYDFANKSAEESGSFDTNWKNGMISNISRVGFFPVLNAIYRFRTPGTQSGNWHLGSPKENQRLYKLSSYIDKKISDKLFDDFWNFGMKKYFYMSTSEYLASCNIEKSKDCNLWYNVYTKIDGDSVVSDRTFVDSKTFVAIPLLRLTAK